MRNKVKLQVIYDLREVTMFVSGKQLHQFFRLLVGDPSPSGNVEVDEETLAETEQGREILGLLNSPLRNHLAAIVEERDLHCPGLSPANQLPSRRKSRKCSGSEFSELNLGGDIKRNKKKQVRQG